MNVFRIQFTTAAYAKGSSDMNGDATWRMIDYLIRFRRMGNDKRMLVEKCIEEMAVSKGYDMLAFLNHTDSISFLCAGKVSCLLKGCNGETVIAATFHAGEIIRALPVTAAYKTNRSLIADEDAIVQFIRKKNSDYITSKYHAFNLYVQKAKEDEMQKFSDTVNFYSKK